MPCSEIVVAMVTPPSNCNAAPGAPEPGATFTIPVPSAVDVVARTMPALMLSDPLHSALLPATTRTPLSFLENPFAPLRLPLSVRVAPPTTSMLLLDTVPFWNKKVRFVAKLVVARKVAEPAAPSLTEFAELPSAASDPAATTPAVTFTSPPKVLAALPRTTVPKPPLAKPPVPLSTPLSVSPCTRLDALAVETVKLPPVLRTMFCFSSKPYPLLFVSAKPLPRSKPFNTPGTSVLFVAWFQSCD